MATRAVSELQPQVDVDQASYHLQELHRGAPCESFTSLVLLGGDRREAHGFLRVDQLHIDDAFRSNVTEELQDAVDQRWNLYTACSTFTEVPERGRGTRTHVASVPGVWADLDVKPSVEGYFRDEHDVRSYVDRLPRPTLEIASGSGGRHLYWLVHPDQRLNQVNGQALLTAWLDFLRAEAAGWVIENVHDTPRILRVAGTVRWPKRGDAVTTARRVCLASVGPRYHADELTLISEAAHTAARNHRSTITRARREAEDAHRVELERRGLPLAVLDHTIRAFNVCQDWEPLLASTGWTLQGDERDRAARCRYWTRPGKSTSDGKSAATDWITDDGTPSYVMTIYTNDEALQDLWENAGMSAAHGICSKWHYAKMRLFEGDDVALLRAIRDGGGVLR